MSEILTAEEVAEIRDGVWPIGGKKIGMLIGTIQLLRQRVEQLEAAHRHFAGCGVCKKDLLCWEGHRLRVAAGIEECKNTETCYVHRS